MAGGPAPARAVQWASTTKEITMHDRHLLRSLCSFVLATSLAACATDGDDDLEPGTSEQAVVGQTTIDRFNAAFDALAAAGVALPTAEEIIDVGTCDVSDPLEPSWSDSFGGTGYRWFDPFKNIWRTYSSPRVGDLHTSAATIKLRFTYTGLTSSVTGGGRAYKIAYDKDAAGTSFEDWNLYYLASGQLDRVKMSEDLGPLTSTTASPGQATATYEVRLGNKVTWSLPCGSITMRGTARLDRPVHVGRVKINAFPIGLIYEPNFPPGDRSFGKGIQEVGATMGTTFTTSVKREDSAQDFSAEASNLNKAKDVLGTLGAVVGKSPFPGASTAGAIIGALGAGLGTDTESVFYGRTDDSSASVQTVLTATERRTTNLMPGVVPTGETGLGKGDQVCWLRGVTFGYVWIDGYLRMIPAGYDESRCDVGFRLRNQIALLRQRASCALYPIFKRPSYCTVQPGEIPGTRTDLEAVAATDPFIANPAFRPETDPARFADCQPMAEVSYEYMWRQASTGTTSTSSALWTSRTISQSPGWLNLFGIGPSVPASTTLKTTHTTLRQTATGSSIGTGFQLFRNGDTYPFVRCLDTVFTSALAVPQ